MGVTGMWVVLGTLLAGLAVGLTLRAREGRIRRVKAGQAPANGLPTAVSDALRADGVTLLQLSTTFCTPCKHTHARLSALAERTDGLHHVDLDVTHQPDVAKDLRVLRAPTTIAFGPDGVELLRISGVPDSDELLAALRPHMVGA